MPASMRTTCALLCLLTSSAYSFILPSPHQIFSNEIKSGQTAPGGFQIPSVEESAVMARRIMRLETIGTLVTVFPNSSSTMENRPSDVGGLPLGMMEYYADCEPDSGNPTFIALNISSSIKNAHAGSNITLSLRWHSPHPTHETPTALPRFALLGSIDWITEEEAKAANLKVCFGKHHPESFAWMPGSYIHESHWARLKVREIYWVGGYGDRAYIGWIPLDVWQSVTEEDIQKIRLPGESSPWPSIGGWLRNLEL